MLEISNLSSDLFGPISLTLKPGECVALRGGSGAGKSVFLRAIADLDPASGSIALNGRARESASGPWWRSQIGLVPARAGWWADIVGEHFDAADREAAIGLMQILGLPAAAWDWQVHRLSSGEGQRLAIVRAVVRQPAVLMLDEPTASLDPTTTRAVEGLLRQLQEAGRMVLVVTHDAAQAVRVARRRYWLADGQLRDPEPGEAVG